MYLIYNLWMHNSMLLFIYFYFLSLMLENLSLSYVLDSPSGHKIHRRSMWKKTILKIEKIRVLPLTVCTCKRACVCSLNPTYASLTMYTHATG